VPDSVKYVNASGLLDHTTDIQGRTVHYTYGDARNTSQPSTITDDSLGRTMTIEYGGPGGAMSKITDATQDSIIFSYNAAGKISRIQDGMDNYTALTYDASGRATKIRYADGTGDQADWVPSYGAGTTTVTDPNSRTAVYSFNATNQVTSVKDGNNNTITGGFDAHDNRTSSTDALGNATTATYNAGNALTKITSPAAGSTGTGGTVSYTYPAPTSVKPSSSADSENASSAYTYDGMASYVDKITAPDGNFTTLNYHGDDEHTGCGAYVGQLCRTTDAKGNVTTYDYALTGDPVTVNRPAPLGVITNTFDGASRLLSSKVGTGPTATYIYDDNDRLFQIRYGATCVPATCVKYTYNGAGMLDSRVDASGTTTYVHDSQNRLLSKAAGGTTTSISYDGASNILSFTDPTGTVLYKYDAGNRLISLAEPGGSCPATPAFPNATKCTGFGYDNANRRTTTTYPNGVKNTTAYDKASRIQSITATNTSAGILAKRAYTYTVLTGGQDGALRKTMTTETGAVTTYGYDTRRRLTSATTAGTTETWQYDPNSNRTKDTKTGTADVHSAFNAADQLCWAGASAGTCTSPPGGATTYSYDANGNTTVSGPSTQGYNVFDQFSSNTNGGVTTNYTYAGPRNDERLAAGATGFLNGSLGITRQTTGGASASFIRDPDGTLISMRNSAGASFYYTTDALGSTILLTDSNQTAAATYAYDSWGLATTATGTQAAVNPWTFAGGYNDTASNRIKFGARYYNPYRGRFTQPDPSGQEQNRYAYVNCNPINATDPTGLGPAECLFNASAAVFSAFVVAGAGAAAVATGGLAIVGLIGAIGLEATTATAAGYYCGELIR
jgi:RHS repeat-associated protein